MDKTSTGSTISKSDVQDIYKEARLKVIDEVNSGDVNPKEEITIEKKDDPETKEIFRADKAEEHMKEKEANKENQKERSSLKAKLEEKKK